MKTTYFFVLALSVSSVLAADPSFWKVYDVKETIDTTNKFISQRSAVRKLQQDGRIAYGQDVPADQFPWMARLAWIYGNSGYVACSGTVIAPNYVLTAAHCLFDQNGKLNPPTQIWIDGINSTDSSNFKENIPVDTAYVPADYDYTNATSTDDVAIIKMSKNSSVTPVSLSSVAPAPGTNITALGWGSTEIDVADSRTLKYTNLTVGAWGQGSCPSSCLQDPCTTECELGIPQGSNGWTSDCPGDSGGPQILPGSNVQVSITSFGPPGCGNATWGASTLVSAVLPYIVNITGVTPAPAPSPSPAPSNTANKVSPNASGNGATTISTGACTDTTGLIASITLKTVKCSNTVAKAAAQAAGQVSGANNFCVQASKCSKVHAGLFIVKAKIAVDNNPSDAANSIASAISDGTFATALSSNLSSFKGSVANGKACAYPASNCVFKR